MFTLGQIHIQTSYALLSLCMDVVGSCGHWCHGKVAFCCSAWRSSAVASTLLGRSCTGRRSYGTSSSVGALVGIGQCQPWRWDKGSRTAKALPRGGRLMAGMVYGAGAVQMRRNREVKVIRMRVCDPHREGTFSSAGSGWLLFCCRSHSAPSGLTAAPQPVSSLPGQGPGEAFWRKGNDEIVWKAWSVSHVCLWVPAHGLRTLPG